MDKVIKLNMRDKAINFEWFNQITQKLRISRPDQGRLENHLKLANRISLMEKNILN